MGSSRRTVNDLRVDAELVALDAPGFQPRGTERQPELGIGLDTSQLSLGLEVEVSDRLGVARQRDDLPAGAERPQAQAPVRQGDEVAARHKPRRRFALERLRALHPAMGVTCNSYVPVVVPASS